MQNVCQQLAQDLGGLFACQPVDVGIRIRTPFLYPDGDVIDLYYRDTPSGVGTISDVGETVRWLRMQTLAPRRSPKQSAMIADAALNHGVEFHRGTLMARVRAPDELAAAVSRVSQAALRVSDIWFTFRTRAAGSVSDDVADTLTEWRIRFERSPKIPGRSATIWTPDFYTHTDERSSLVYVLSSGNRPAARKISHTVHTAWYDLSHMTVGPEPKRLVSLFDDTVDVWTEEDFRLLEAISTVARWSDPDRFREMLAA